ncbi:MAG: hypothetical protein ACLFTK_10635 [Anaerolineales bacterium]
MPNTSNWHAPDELLQAMVALVNEGRISFRVKVIIDGAIFVGTVISGRDYVKALEDIFAGSVTDLEPSDDSALTALKKVTDALQPRLPNHDHVAHADEMAFIHLKDVEILSPLKQSFADVVFPYWRLRLVEVEGWTIA